MPIFSYFELFNSEIDYLLKLIVVGFISGVFFETQYSIIKVVGWNKWRTGRY